MQGETCPRGRRRGILPSPTSLSARPFFSMSILPRAKWLNLDEKNNSQELPWQRSPHAVQSASDGALCVAHTKACLAALSTEHQGFLLCRLTGWPNTGSVWSGWALGAGMSIFSHCSVHGARRKCPVLTTTSTGTLLVPDVSTTRLQNTKGGKIQRRE